MHLAGFLDCDAIKTALPGGNKRSLMKQLADLAGQRLSIKPAIVLAGLNEREQLGSTGFGQGVAIPHAKIDGLEKVYGLFVRLGDPVDYKAIDGRPVDLVFLLLSPPDAGAGRAYGGGAGGIRRDCRGTQAAAGSGSGLMRIVSVKDAVVPIASAIANAYIDFSKMTA